MGNVFMGKHQWWVVHCHVRKTSKNLSPGDDVGAGSFWAFQWVNHRMFCRSHHIRTITGWWLTYPSEKYEYQPDYHGTIRTSRLSHQVIDNPGSPQILGYPIDNWTPSAPAECLFALVGYLAIKHSKRTFMKIPPYFENFPSSMSPNAPCMEYLPNIYLPSDRNVGTYSIYWACHEKFETFFQGRKTTPRAHP